MLLLPTSTVRLYNIMGIIYPLPLATTVTRY